jgi:DNA invertase Pin-like site-specific DNA recombinase
LEISEAELKAMKIIIDKDEKKVRNNEQRKFKRRNKDGLTKREQNKQEMINIIKEKLNQGLGIRTIARDLKVSVSTVSDIKNDKY